MRNVYADGMQSPSADYCGCDSAKFFIGGCAKHSTHLMVDFRTPRILLFRTTSFPQQGFSVDSTLLKGLAVLERLSQADNALGVSALATEFDLPKSNLHRTLSTLVAAGYASQDENGSYKATLKSWELGVKTMAKHPLQRTAVPYMHELQKISGETVNLVVVEGDDSLYIHQLSAALPIRPSKTVGERAPAILSIAGKTILANQADYQKRLRELYRAQKNPKPPFKLNELLNEAEDIRNNGYCMTQSFLRPHINSLACVILGPNSLPMGAIAVTGAKERYNKKAMQNLIPHLLNACTNIGRALGH